MSSVTNLAAAVSESSFSPTQLLFDRIINVQLHWTEESHELPAMFVTSRGTLVKASELTNTTARGGVNWHMVNGDVYKIAYHKGWEHLEYTVTGPGELSSTKVKAKNAKRANTETSTEGGVKKVLADGGLYTYDLNNPSDMAAWMRGADPVFGYTLSANVRLKVITLNGEVEKYHTVRIEETGLRYVRKDENGKTIIDSPEMKPAVGPLKVIPKGVIPISCPDAGIKPDISFKINQLPGLNCYGLTLQITNLHLDVNIRQITHITITAGYREDPGNMYTFTCPVFSSYLKSPGPDSVTVFECYCVGQSSRFTKNQSIKLHYLGGKVTIADFVAAIGRGLNLTVVNKLLNPYTEVDATGKTVTKPGYNGLEISMQKMNTYAENATAVVLWARKIIQQRIAAEEHAPTSGQDGYKYQQPCVMMHVSPDGKLYVYLLNRKNQDEGKADIYATVPSLNFVKGASFNGVALTVKSVWNPCIAPGEIFQMKPSVYEGAHLPNSLSAEAFGGEEQEYDENRRLVKGNQYLYRCITSTVSFSTNGGENEMTVLAVPVKYVDPVTTYSDGNSLTTVEEFAKYYKDNFSVLDALTIVLGDGKTDDKENKNVAVIRSNTNNMFGVNISGVFSNTLDYVIVSGDSLTQLAEDWYNENGGPNGRIYCGFPLDVAPSTVNAKAYIGPIPKCALWPIISVLTYYYGESNKSSSGRANQYETMERLSNPDMIRVGRHLVIPTIENWSQLVQCREIFKFAAKAWSVESFPKYEYLIAYWKSLYQYLGGTWS